MIPDTVTCIDVLLSTKREGADQRERESKQILKLIKVIFDKAVKREKLDFIRLLLTSLYGALKWES